MAGIRITLKETGQQSIARLWVDNRGGARLNVPESLRFLRLCYRHKINREIEKNSGGELEKGFYFFNYKTKDIITIFYEASGTLQNFSFEKNEKYSNYYNKQIYQIKIGKLGFINCLSVDDRDVLFKFLTEEKFEYMLQNKVTINKKEYTYNSIYNSLERIKADLIKEKKYNTLNENERLLLDLPLIMWSKKWEYGSIFMFNWFMEGGDIIMDNDLYTFLDNWKKLKEIENTFKTIFIKNNKWKRISKPIEDDKFQTYAFRLYPLNDLRKYISEVENDETKKNFIDIKLSNRLTNNHLNFSKYSIKIGWLDDINNRYIASFGTFSIEYLLEGVYNKEKREIFVSIILEEINDSFDFKDDGWLSQPLGVWNKSIFKYYDKVGIFKNIDPSDDRLNISNSTFNSFRSKTKMGKDFHIKGKRKINDLFIKTIKIDSNDVQYQ